MAKRLSGIPVQGLRGRLREALWAWNGYSESLRNKHVGNVVGVDVELIQADTPALVEVARELMLEYSRGIEVDLCFQGFDRELAELPGRYSPPLGRLILARCGDGFMGCVALRPHEPTICEMKRLYIRPAARNRGLGRLLATARDQRRAGTSDMTACGWIRSAR
jgi:GNAT superfamily N-acetyltransferase